MNKKVILWDTDYGIIKFNLKYIMEEKNISISRLSRLTGIKFEIIKKYYTNSMIRYDGDIVAKMCYVLDCRVDDLIEYVSSKKLQDTK